MRALVSCNGPVFFGSNVQLTLKPIILGLSFLFLSQISYGQIKVGDNPQDIDDGSLIELESTNKAFVVPRMTQAQRDNIPTPLKGAVIFNLDEKLSSN